MNIRWIKTSNIPGAFRHLRGDCECGRHELLSGYNDSWHIDCWNIAELFLLPLRCSYCSCTKSVAEWLGDKTQEVYLAICEAKPEWSPGVLSTKSGPIVSSDVDKKLKRMRDDNLRRAFA